MRWRLGLVIAPVAVTGAFLACNLNPQPLPPENMAANDKGGEGGSFRGDAEAAEPTTPPPNPSDAGTGAFDGDGSADADSGDGGDGGDGGDEDGG
jgi:hypothetical protein